MAIKSDPRSKPNRWSVWMLGACTLVASAVAVLLAWENVELEAEVKALKRETPSGSVSASQPPGNEKPTQNQVATTSSAAETAHATADKPARFLDALKASEKAATDKQNSSSAAYPFGATKQ